MKREEITDPGQPTQDTLRVVPTSQTTPASPVSAVNAIAPVSPVSLVSPVSSSRGNSLLQSSSTPHPGHQGHQGPGSQSGPTQPTIARFPNSRLSDAELVAAITQGENEALGVIWDRYSGTVRAVLRSSLGYDADVEDLLQEVFIAFLQGASRLRSADSLRGYLVGVAVRLVMGELRRRRVRRWVTLQPSEELAQAAAPMTYDEDAKAAVHALYRLLDAMPTRRRMAFVLRHVEGMEVIEAARVLSVSESTVKREARKARKAIEVRAERSEPRLWQYMQNLDASDHD